MRRLKVHSRPSSVEVQLVARSGSMVSGDAVPGAAGLHYAFADAAHLPHAEGKALQFPRCLRGLRPWV